MSDIAYILLANRNPMALAPLSEDVPPALFPFAGRPLIGHWLDFMTSQNMQNIYVVLHESDAITGHIVREHWPDVHIGLDGLSMSRTSALMMRADVVPAIQSLKRTLANAGKPYLLTKSDIQQGMIWREDMSQGSIYDDVTYYGSSDLLLPDMSAYMNMTFAAHMGLLNDELMIDKHNKSCIGQKIYINPTAHVDESVEMGGHVVIHGGAFIGPHVSLENVIVMSGVLIEPHSHFKNCLLSQEWIYHHEKGRIERHMIRPAYKIEAPITNAA